MSLAESMGSQFFSLPYDRERYGSLERLIGDGVDNVETNDHNNDFVCDSGRNRGTIVVNHGTGWSNAEKRDFDTTGNQIMSRSVDTRNLNTSWSNGERSGHPVLQRNHSDTPRNHFSDAGNQNRDLIDFDNRSDFRSCHNLDSTNGDFTDLNNKNLHRNLELGSSDNTESHCNGDLTTLAVDLRNRRNCGGSTGDCTDHRHTSDLHQTISEHNASRYRQYITPVYDFNERCSTSLPDTFDDRDRSVCGGNGYGSLPGDDMSNPDHSSVTYCVHGKPGAGCCATLVGQPAAPTINISFEEHCHIKERDTGVNKKARRQIIIVSLLCLFFMIAEAIGGYFSGSLAIATDAAHLLTDFAGFMISLLALYVAARKPSRVMPFGWHRAEVIGATVSVLTIWLVTGILVYLAVQRLISGDFEIDAFVMLITSAIGVIVNIIMALTLHQHSHASHAHACSHGSGATSAIGSEGPAEKQNINVRAAFIHIIGDLLQSVGVFIAATIIYYKPEYSMVDPICTFLFSILVLLTTVNIMKDALLVLMEGIPRDVDFNDVLSTLLAIDGVIRVHNLRIWALSLDKTALSAHLAIAPSSDCTEILKVASKEIHKKYNFFEMTLQIEYFQQNMETCTQCQVPT